MFGYDNRKIITLTLGDPTADRNVQMFRAPQACEVVALYATDGVGVVGTAGTGFALTVYNGGTSGTAQTVVGSALGGTSTTWVALVPKAFSLGDGTMAAGENLWVAYDETGTVAQFITVQAEVIFGVAAS